MPETFAPLHHQPAYGGPLASVASGLTVARMFRQTAARHPDQQDFRNGWFHMGDVFQRNPDGTLEFVDRRKYLIKSGGENIYPAEIERILLASPRIADAVVVRRPDDRWGEVPVAFIVSNDAVLDYEDVVGMCRGKIASYKLPKAIRIVTDSELPRSTTGKVKRHELEELLKAEPGDVSPAVS